MSGTDDSVDTSVESVATSVESVDMSVESVDEARVVEVEVLDEVDEVDEDTVVEVAVLVDDVVAGCVVVVVDPPDAACIHHNCGPINARVALPPLLEGEASSSVGVVASSSARWASAMAASLSSCVSKHNAELS